MYIYGRNILKECLNSKSKIKQAYVNKDFNDQSLLSQLRNACKINYVTTKELDEIVRANHQGIILEVEDYKYYGMNDINEDIVVILDHIEDPQNMGAIIRTCEAAGITSVIIPKDRSTEVNNTVMKTSAGTLSRVKIIKVVNLINTIKELKEKGFWIIGTELEGENYTNIDYNGKIAIIVGNEGSGMSKLVKENCDFLATIPMKGTVNSLNASVAIGIVIFEAIKQREK